MNEEFTYEIESMYWVSEKSLHFVVNKFENIKYNANQREVPWRQLDLCIDFETGNLTWKSKIGGTPKELIELHKVKKSIDDYIRTLIHNTQIAKELVNFSTEKGNFYEE